MTIREIYNKVLLADVMVWERAWFKRASKAGGVGSSVNSSRASATGVASTPSKKQGKVK